MAVKLALRRGVVAAGASLAVAGTLLAPPSAVAEPWSKIDLPLIGKITEAERDYCAAHWVACGIEKDAAEWARSTAIWRYNNDASLEDGVGDAYRHCIFAGALTQRLGEEQATTLLNIHELQGPEVPLKVSIMDYANNATGVKIGAQANQKGGSDTWGWIMEQCGALADSGQLKTLK
jgi:hypothetical protein